jgi:hypothetical protein
MFRPFLAIFRPVRSVDQCILLSGTHLGIMTIFCYFHTVAGLLKWGTLSEERMDLWFAIAAGPRQRSHFRVQVQQDSWPYFAVSYVGLPQSSRSRSYIEADGQSDSSFWCRAPFGTDVQVLICLGDSYFLTSLYKVLSLTRGRVCNLQCNHKLVRVAQDT